MNIGMIPPHFMMLYHRSGGIFLNCSHLHHIAFLYNKIMKHKIGKWILSFLIIISLIFSGYYGYHLFKENQYIATIVIDAGHGGYDVGSIGYDGTYEKELTLSIALKTGKRLKELVPDIKVVYTRTDDTVDWANNERDDLIGRVIFAKEQNADYFLSIHMNASENTSAYGYNAYIRSNDEASRSIAESIDQNLTEAGWLYNRGLQYTDTYPLYVVDNLDIPSMLFEVGFITNPQECHDLSIPSNQELIADCIAQAYKDYINLTNEQK